MRCDPQPSAEWTISPAGPRAGRRAAAIACAPIETAKPDGVDPQAPPADTLARIPDQEITRVDDPLPRDDARESGG